MAELRKCKECGKMFMPKGREQYCSDVHYRPCPICGTPVIAKYLSDPPRKCDNCRGRRSAAAKPSKPSKLFKFNDSQMFKFGAAPKVFNEPKSAQAILEPVITPKENKGLYNPSDILTELPETIDQEDFCTDITGTVRRYIGPVIKNGFVPGHDYELEVSHSGQCYGVRSGLDVTDHAEVNIYLHYTSQISINQNFARLKEA